MFYILTDYIELRSSSTFVHLLGKSWRAGRQSNNLARRLDDRVSLERFAFAHLIWGSDVLRVGCGRSALNLDGLTRKVKDTFV
jgi:hypothetical protein